MEKNQRGLPVKFFMGKIFFKKFPNFVGMLVHPKKVSTINFGPIQQFYAALKIGKVTENPKIP